MVLIIVTLAYSWDAMGMCWNYEMVSKIFQLTCLSPSNIKTCMYMLEFVVIEYSAKTFFQGTTFFFLQRERSMGLVDHLLWILSSVSGLSFLELTLTGTDNTSINGGALLPFSVSSCTVEYYYYLSFRKMFDEFKSLAHEDSQAGYRSVVSYTLLDFLGYFKWEMPLSCPICM